LACHNINSGFFQSLAMQSYYLTILLSYAFMILYMIWVIFTCRFVTLLHVFFTYLLTCSIHSNFSSFISNLLSIWYYLFDIL